jgi:hypothetical protein
VPLKIRHRPGRKTVATPAQGCVPAVATRADPALVKALARAFRYQRLLDEGRYASISEMAQAALLRGAVVERPDAIIFAPAGDHALEGPVAEATAAGIPLIGFVNRM